MIERVLPLLVLSAAALFIVAWQLWLRLRAQSEQLEEIRRALRMTAAAAERAGFVAAGELRATRPLRWEEDTALSPFTGLARSSWRGIATGMLENVLQYTGGLTAPLRLPPSPHAGYPSVLDRTGTGPRTAYLEGFARTLLLAAPLLRERPELAFNGRSVADYYRKYLLQGVHDGACGFGVPTSPEPEQTMVEAAAIAIAISEARGVLWDELSAGERRAVLTWFEALADRPVVPNNWRWFSVIINTFLKREGARYRQDIIDTHIRAIGQLYRGAGWYRDLDKFDYYSSWVFQFYPTFWLEWDDGVPADLRREFIARRDDFLESLTHVLSRDGSMPLWGRSICYRFAATAPLGVAWRTTPLPPIDPGFARRLCSGNLLQFVRQPGFLRDGVVTLGFAGEQPELIDHYTCTASPYWCAKLFLALSMDDGNPFWSAVEQEGYWVDPPPRFEFEGTGMWTEHSREDGSTRLYAPGNGPAGDPRYNAQCFVATCGSGVDRADRAATGEVERCAASQAY